MPAKSARRNTTSISDAEAFLYPPHLTIRTVSGERMAHCGSCNHVGEIVNRFEDPEPMLAFVVNLCHFANKHRLCVGLDR